MATAIFRLPPAIRVHLWTAYLQNINPIPSWALPRPNGSILTGLRSSYATVHVGQEWTNATNTPVKAIHDDNFPSSTDIVEAAKAALDSQASASEEEIAVVLANLQECMDSIPAGSTGKKALWRRISDAQACADPLPAIMQAIQGQLPASWLPAPDVSLADLKDRAEFVDRGRDLSQADYWADVLVKGSYGEDKDRESLVLRDAEYVQTSMPLPSKEAYPEVGAKLFTSIAVSTSDSFLNMWKRYTMKNCSPQTFMHVEYKPKTELSESIASQLAPGGFTCCIDVRLPGDVHIRAVGAGVSKTAARRAANLHAISKLHTTGQLRQIFDLLATHGSKKATSESMCNTTSGTQQVGEFGDTSQQDPSIPTRQDYPLAPKGLFREGGWETAVGNSCREAGILFKCRGDDSKNDEYVLSVTVGDFFADHVIGIGERKQEDASRKMLRKLHTAGALHRLFRCEPAEKERKVDTEHTLNQQAVSEHMDMPTKQQYPHAPSNFFIQSQAPVAIHNACAQLGYSLEVEWKVANIRDSSRTYQLRVDIARVCSVTATGRGQNKQMAKRDAWRNAIQQMHAEGALRKLFPGTAVQTQETGSRSQCQPHYEETELDSVSKGMLEGGKDAKIEVYNYAARLGLVPIFEFETVKTLGRRRLKGRLLEQQSAVRVTISLPKLDISVSFVGKTLASADIAAALEFRRLAELKDLSQVGVSSAAKPNSSRLLTVESAPQFFEMYRSLHREAKIQLEHKTIDIAGRGHNTVKVLINNVETGPSATMQTRKEAEAVAYLGAALTMVADEPGLLDTFAEALRTGNGKILPDVRPLDATIDSSTLYAMRETLVEARRAGLPDGRKALAAEEVSRPDSKININVVGQEERELASKRLRATKALFEEDATFAQLRETRASLPMNSYQSRVLNLISNNVFSIIVGSTGSGKTTQVPQILLDDAIRNDKGGFCDVICTQPRRLAASSIARRVAVERNETLGKSVGYHVRFDAKRPQPGGSITYCTTGILLEQMKRDADDILENVSHLVIDEVHERDISIDFLLNILRKTIRARQQARKRVPKVILMSATLDEKLFATYFGREIDGHIIPCPALHVPGRTFTVQKKYLDEILPDLRTSYGSDFSRLLDLDSSSSKDYIAAEMAFSGTSLGQQPDNVIDRKRERDGEFDNDNQITKKEQEDALVPLSLLVGTIAHICNTTPDGSILAFLPGAQEIAASRGMLLQQPLFGVDFNDTSRFTIHILHSGVPPEEQRAVLDPALDGCRKIILSTNIAETSVTVPDVKYVVDPGKLREKRYDQVRRITKLQCTWESKSNARQRAGRAGRVQEGSYYALYTRERRQSWEVSGRPEILRSDLQETCLAIKAQAFNEPVANFLAESIQPPSAQAVHIAIENLQAIEALTAQEELTTLGRILSELPLHPTLGKMVILGIVFRCLDPMLVLSCISSERPLFHSPVAGKTLAREAHARYHEADSDHIALLNAFKVLRRLRAEVGPVRTSMYGHTNFLHMGAFETIMSTAKQIEQTLIEAGLVPQAATWARINGMFGGEELNRHSNNTALVKCLLLAGLHPNLGVRVPEKPKAYRTPAEFGVLMHPSSMNWKRTAQASQDGDSLYIYNALAKSADGTALFMRDSTRVTPLMAILFGGKLRTENWSRLEMDEWLSFKIVAPGDARYATQLILEFRKALHRMLNDAFRSISDLQSGTSPAQNMVTDQFVRGVAQMLDERKMQRRS